MAKVNSNLVRRLWAGEKVDYEDEYYSFTDVELKPTPLAPIPIWYGGGTPASCRRAVDYCDGWMPGRIPLATFTSASSTCTTSATRRASPWSPPGPSPSPASPRTRTPR